MPVHFYAISVYKSHNLERLINDLAASSETFDLSHVDIHDIFNTGATPIMVMSDMCDLIKGVDVAPSNMARVLRFLQMMYSHIEGDDISRFYFEWHEEAVITASVLWEFN